MSKSAQGFKLNRINDRIKKELSNKWIAYFEDEK